MIFCPFSRIDASKRERRRKTPIFGTIFDLLLSFAPIFLHLRWNNIWAITSRMWFRAFFFSAASMLKLKLILHFDAHTEKITIHFVVSMCVARWNDSTLQNIKEKVNKMNLNQKKAKMNEEKERTNEKKKIENSFFLHFLSNMFGRLVVAAIWLEVRKQTKSLLGLEP